MKKTDDQKLILEALKLEKKLGDVLKDHFKNKTTDHAFKVVTFAYPSLLANFACSVIKDEFHQDKLKLVDQIGDLTKMIIEGIRQKRSRIKH